MPEAAARTQREESTLRLDLSGKANFLFDLFDPESMEMVDDEMPAEIHELDVNELKLEVAGADLTGNGGFTFDTLTLNATSAVYPDEFCVDRSTGQMLNVPLFAPRVSDQAGATMEYGEKGAPHRCGCPVTCPTDLSDP